MESLTKLFAYVPLRVAAGILLFVFLSAVIPLLFRWFRVRRELNALSNECANILSNTKFVTFETLDPLSELMGGGAATWTSLERV